MPRCRPPSTNSRARLDALPDGDPGRIGLVTQLANFNTTLDQLRVDAALRTGGAAIIKSAEVPTSPIEPTPARTAVLAGVVGLLIGLGAAFLIDYLDDKVRSEDDLERLTDRPVLAVVPVDPPPDHRPLALSRPGDIAVEAYRGLRTNVQFLGLDEPISVVQLTSSMAGEGKTTTSANLAVVLAQAGHRVALLDADLRRPRIHELFGIPQVPGFTDILLGAEPRDVITHVDIDGGNRLSVYPSGAVPSNPSELLSGRRTKRLLSEMGKYYDFVIVDSAPILPVSDSVALAGAVDGVIVVVQAGRASDDNVVDTLERLDRVSAPILGTVLNQAAKSTTDNYSYGGYQATPRPPSDRTFEIERPTAEELAEVEAALEGSEPPTQLVDAPGAHGARGAQPDDRFGACSRRPGMARRADCRDPEARRIHRRRRPDHRADMTRGGTIRAPQPGRRAGRRRHRRARRPARHRGRTRTRPVRPYVDWILVGVGVAAVVWAAASAPWWAVAGAAGIAAVVAFEPIVAAVAAVAFGLGLWIGVRQRDQSTLRAIVAAVAMNALIRSELDGFLGLSAIIGITVGVALFVVGLRRRPSAIRRIGWISAASIGAVAVVAVVAAGWTAFTVRSDLTDGSRQARGAVDVLDSGDYQQAAVGFRAAANSFDSVDRRLDSPLGRLALVVPGVAQNVSAGADLSAAAAATLDDVAVALEQVDPEALRVVGGAIDVDAISAVEAPLAQVQASLADLRQVTADVQSPWLLGRLQDELADLTREFDEKEPRLDNAVDAVRLAPQILGADGSRRYLVLFTSPVEARGLTGFIGNYAVVEIDEGQIRVTDFGRRSDLQQAANESGASCAECPEEMLARYGDSGLDRGDGTFGSEGWTSLTLPAHFPYVAEAAQIMFPQSGGDPIDGVIAMDPHVVQALMQYTGPIELAEAGLTVQPDEAARFLLEGQYDLIPAGSNDERIEAIDTLGQQVIGTLLTSALPVPSELAGDLGPLASEHRLLMWTDEPAEQDILDRVGLLGALPPLGDDGGFSVMVSNAGHNKIDAYLDRTVDTTIENRPDGTRVLIAEVTLTNTAPENGLPAYVIGNDYGFPPGTSYLWINFFGPDKLLGATRNGEPMTLQTSPSTEVGWHAYDGYEVLASGETATYRLEFELGPADDEVDDPTVWLQPLARRTP